MYLIKETIHIILIYYHLELKQWHTQDFSMGEGLKN